MPAGANYEIARSTGVCAATGSPLEPGAPCIACLCESDDGGLHRKDYSLAAWESATPGSRPGGLFSYWRTTVPEPNQKRKVFVDDDLLINLFERLEGDARPQRVALRFVIGLILLRKKRFKSVGKRVDCEYHTQNDGREGEHRCEHCTTLWLLQLRGSTDAGEDPPMFEVVDPHLSDEDIHSISEQLGEILSGDFEPPLGEGGRDGK